MLKDVLAKQKALGKELIRAIAVGETALVHELIASGADVETRDPEVGFMLMHCRWVLSYRHSCCACCPDDALE